MFLLLACFVSFCLSVHVDLDRTNLTTFTTKATVPTLLFIGAPWCGHCKRAKPAWAQAAETVDESVAVFASVDGAAQPDLAAQFGVRGFPSFFVIGPGGSPVGQYKGGRTAKDFVALATDREAQAALPAVAEWTAPNSLLGRAYGTLAFVGAKMQDASFALRDSLGVPPMVAVALMLAVVTAASILFSCIILSFFDSAPAQSSKPKKE